MLLVDRRIERSWTLVASRVPTRMIQQSSVRHKKTHLGSLRRIKTCSTKPLYRNRSRFQEPAKTKTWITYESYSAATFFHHCQELSCGIGSSFSSTLLSTSCVWYFHLPGLAHAQNITHCLDEHRHHFLFQSSSEPTAYRSHDHALSNINVGPPTSERRPTDWMITRLSINYDYIYLRNSKRRHKTHTDTPPSWQTPSGGRKPAQLRPSPPPSAHPHFRPIQTPNACCTKKKLNLAHTECFVSK